MICALFSRLFRSIDFGGSWTRRNRGGGPLLDHEVARGGRPITITTDGQPLRIGMYLELHRKDTSA